MQKCTVRGFDRSASRVKNLGCVDMLGEAHCQISNGLVDVCEEKKTCNTGGGGLILSNDVDIRPNNNFQYGCHSSAFPLNLAAVVSLIKGVISKFEFALL